MGKIIAAIALLVLGGIMMVRFQIWSQRVLMGAQYVPSHRTFTVMRTIGTLLFIIGLIILIWKVL